VPGGQRKSFVVQAYACGFFKGVAEGREEGGHQGQMAQVTFAPAPASFGKIGQTRKTTEIVDQKIGAVDVAMARDQGIAQGVMQPVDQAGRCGVGRDLGDQIEVLAVIVSRPCCEGDG
tara:strand:+ start:1206 stop:1559 length:354 start_codon:yes stop_codon:yes gene_type:complete